MKITKRKKCKYRVFAHTYIILYMKIGEENSLNVKIPAD